MSIAETNFIEFAVPVTDCEISKAYWQTDKHVTDIAVEFGMKAGSKVSNKVCAARLRGIVCSSCGEEMVTTTRAKAIGLVKDHLNTHPWAKKRIKCEMCDREERARRYAPKPSKPATEAPPTQAKDAVTPATDAKTEFYQSWDWRTLRMKVLHQYGSRCMCCGATPEHKTIGGEPVVIVVDHIKPLSKRWDLRLDRGNLQVLCQECNQGKGAWDETDYRPVPKTQDGKVIQ